MRHNCEAGTLGFANKERSKDSSRGEQWSDDAHFRRRGTERHPPGDQDYQRQPEQRSVLLSIEDECAERHKDQQNGRVLVPTVRSQPGQAEA